MMCCELAVVRNFMGVMNENIYVVATVRLLHAIGRRPAFMHGMVLVYYFIFAVFLFWLRALQALSACWAAIES